MTATLSADVRELIYRDAVRVIDWVAGFPKGRQHLRAQAARARAVLRKPGEHDAQTSFYAAWLLHRITSALDRHKRVSKRARVAIGPDHSAKAARICALLSPVVWDEHKLTPLGRLESIREALSIAEDIVEGRA